MGESANGPFDVFEQPLSDRIRSSMLGIKNGGMSLTVPKEKRKEAEDARVEYVGIVKICDLLLMGQMSSWTQIDLPTRRATCQYTYHYWN